MVQNKHLSSVGMEKRLQKISSKLKVGVLTLFSNLDNILKLPICPTGASVVMPSEHQYFYVRYKMEFLPDVPGMQSYYI